MVQPSMLMFGQPSELIQIVQRGMACQQAGKLDAAEALYKQALPSMPINSKRFISTAFFKPSAAISSRPNGW